MLKRIFLNDTLIAALVVLNTFVIFMGGLFHEDSIVTIIDDAFTVIFIIEAIVKIQSLTWTEYWKDGWNRFDFFVLLLALPSIVNLFVPEMIATNAILAVRSFRIFKTLRLMKAIPHIGELLNGIKNAIQSSLLVCIALVVSLFVISILTTTLFGRICPEHFGNTGISLYSIFRLFTIEGWYDLPDKIAANSSTTIGVLARIYFSVLLFAGGILGMSLINSIFVDAIMADNNDDVKEELEEMRHQLSSIEEMLRQEQEKNSNITKNTINNDTDRYRTDMQGCE